MTTEVIGRGGDSGSLEILGGGGGVMVGAGAGIDGVVAEIIRRWRGKVFVVGGEILVCSEGRGWMLSGRERVNAAVRNILRRSYEEVESGRVAIGASPREGKEAAEAVLDDFHMEDEWQQGGGTMLPRWVGEGEGPVGLGEVGIRVNGGLCVVNDGGYRFVREESHQWVDPVLVDVEGGEDRWESGGEEFRGVLRQWSGGDREWEECLQMTFGYLLSPYREIHRIPLLVGNAGTGKSTTMKLLRRFLGKSGYFGTTIGALAGEYGLDGATLARVLVVNEVYEMESWTGAKVAAMLKVISGGDEVSANIKYVKQKRLMMGAAPVLVSNELPKLPDHGKGMSNRLVVLPFSRRFRGTTDERRGLEAALWREKEWVFGWAMKGLVRLLRGDPWVMGEGGRKAMSLYTSKANPIMAFLEERCLRVEGSFVSKEDLWGAWQIWREERDAEIISDKRLLSRLIDEGGWGLVRDRAGGGGARGLRGLALRNLGPRTLREPVRARRAMTEEESAEMDEALNGG